MARSAVIAGTATHVSNNVSRRQQARWQRKEEEQMAAQPTYAAPAAVPAARADPVERLKELAGLRDQGILTEEEFASQKAKVLGEAA